MTAAEMNALAPGDVLRVRHPNPRNTFRLVIEQVACESRPGPLVIADIVGRLDDGGRQDIALYSYETGEENPSVFDAELVQRLATVKG